MAQEKGKPDAFRKAVVWAAFSLCLCVSAVNLSCGSKVTDMRTLVPAETLVYLETNDLAAALQPIVDSKPFTEVAKSKPDFSALKGVQLAVAVTGFETSEEKLTDEHSVGRVQPHFVAVADTHAWNYQAVAFAEKKLGSFVTEIYDSEPKLERSDKNGGKYFTWTATDGRKAYALVIDSLIYFGNDETAIDKCLAVKRGESDSITKAGKVQASVPGTLASGYVGPDGIAQIANIVGLKFASEAGEDSEVQSAVASILPEILRKSITEITWTATKTEQGIEDNYRFALPAEMANVLNETMAPAESLDNSLVDVVPAREPGVTVYNFKNPQIAWRSMLLLAQQTTDPLGAKIIASISAMLLEPYGIQNIEMFLNSVGSTLVTIKNDMEGENRAIVARVHNQKAAEESVSDAAKPLVTLENGDRFRTWKGDSSQLKIAFVGGNVISGEERAVDDCLIERDRKLDPINPKLLAPRNAAITTIGFDTISIASLGHLFVREGHSDTELLSNYVTETRFTKTGIERKTVSDFGLIASIIAQLNAE